MSSAHISVPRADLMMAIDDLRLNGYNYSADLLKKAFYAAPVSAEPVAHRLLRRNGDGEWVHDAKHWVNGWPPPELIRDCGQTPELYRIEVAYAVPVVALPDVTQQTLDDVMAGIPARDAEIEALRREIETVQAQQDASKVDAWRTDDVGLHAALSAEFSKHPQTKAVLGREALVLRCVRAAIDAAHKEQT